MNSEIECPLLAASVEKVGFSADLNSGAKLRSN
jgi:hypothetical protein